MEINITIIVLKLLAQLTQCHKETEKTINNEYKVDVNKFFKFAVQLQMFSEKNESRITCIKNQNLRDAFVRSLIVFGVYKNVLLSTKTIMFGYPFYEKVSLFSLLYVLNIYCEGGSIFDAEREEFEIGTLNGINNDKIEKLEIEWGFENAYLANRTTEEMENATNFYNNFNDNLNYNFNEVNEDRKRFESLTESELTYNEKKLYILKFVSILNKNLKKQLDIELKGGVSATNLLGFFIIVLSVFSAHYTI